MVVREIAGRWTAMAAARALADREGLVVLASDPRGALRREDARASYCACDPVEASCDLVPPAGPSTRGWNGLPAAPRWVGAIPYEALRGIERARWTGEDLRAPASFARPRWQRYDAILRVDAASGRAAIEADDARAADRLARALANPQRPREVALEPLEPFEPEARHAERVRAVLDLIAEGDVYQVNLARPIDLSLRGDPLELFARHFARAPVPYGFFARLGAHAVCATSPELALEARGGWLRTAPIKGTRPRGVEAREDAALARALDGDPKERAELTMAIDLHRNDLGRVAVPGSVRVLGAPRLLAGRTVWSRAAEVVARRAPATSDEDLARAMLPCGSVTGAPKVRAMEVIASLEPRRRGLYTGAFGYVARDGALVLAMAIRTLVAHDGRAEYFTGGGIVADSDPARELDETRWKAAHL